MTNPGAPAAGRPETVTGTRSATRYAYPGESHRTRPGSLAGFVPGIHRESVTGGPGILPSWLIGRPAWLCSPQVLTPALEDFRPVRPRNPVRQVAMTFASRLIRPSGNRDFTRSLTRTTEA